MSIQMSMQILKPYLIDGFAIAAAVALAAPLLIAATAPFARRI